MKSPTSWTRQQASDSYCPKRFYFRYLSKNNEIAASLLRLMSARELGGHLIHQALAGIVTRVASGAHISDESGVIADTLQRFEEIVEASCAAGSGKLTGDLQLVEPYNGAIVEEDISHWKEVIPVCVENGIRTLIHFGVRSNTENYRVEAERRIRFQHQGREHTCVIDLLISEPKRTVVLDYKCHAIQNRDLQQVLLYQSYLAKACGVPASRLYGFCVDLLREEILEKHYRPYDQISKAGYSAPSDPIARKGINQSRDPYAPRPSLENCQACPFTSICSESMVTPRTALNNFGRALDEARKARSG